MRDGLGVQRVVDHDSSFERLAELLSSLRRQRVEVSGNRGGGECGAELGRGVEAQGECISRDSNFVEPRVLQQLPKLRARFSPARVATAGTRDGRAVPEGGPSIRRR